MEVNRNTKQALVRPKHLERRDTQTHTQTHTQTLELSCAMQNKKWGEPLSLISPIS